MPRRLRWVPRRPGYVDGSGPADPGFGPIGPLSLPAREPRLASMLLVLEIWALTLVAAMIAAVWLAFRLPPEKP